MKVGQNWWEKRVNFQRESSSFSRFGLLLDFERGDKSLFSIPLFDLQVQHFKRPELGFINHPEIYIFSQIDTVMGVMGAQDPALFHGHNLDEATSRW
jgi:hypothetical protein